MKEEYGYIDESLPYYDDDNFGFLGPRVKILFSVVEERFIEGTPEEKLEIANSELRKQNNPSKVLHYDKKN